MFINNQEQCNWIREKFETPDATKSYTNAEKRLLLARLVRSTKLVTFVSNQWFSGQPRLLNLWWQCWRVFFVLVFFVHATHNRKWHASFAAGLMIYVLENLWWWCCMQWATILWTCCWRSWTIYYMYVGWCISPASELSSINGAIFMLGTVLPSIRRRRRLVYHYMKTASTKPGSNHLSHWSGCPSGPRLEGHRGGLFVCLNYSGMQKFEPAYISSLSWIVTWWFMKIFLVFHR